MVGKIKMNFNILKGQYSRRILSKKNKKKVLPVDEMYLSNILSELSEDTVFLHCGLGSIKRAFNKEDPYNFLMAHLSQNFDNILVPGFTLDYFKKTRIYHKIFSYPHTGLGAFSKMFFENDTDYRTNDCIHSILVKGNYRFDECNHLDTFSIDGCFGKLDKENILILNIGTNELRASQIHYIEYQYSSKIRKKAYDGIIYYDEYNYEKVKQVNFEPNRNFIGLQYNWNRSKIVKEMKKAGILKDFSVNGLNIFAFRARDLRILFENKIKEDPFYLMR